MPVYDYVCRSCGSEKETFKTLAEYEFVVEFCSRCEQEMEQFFPYAPDRDWET